MAKPRVAQPQPDDPEQFKRFQDAAKELGCDEDPKGFDVAFSKLVPAKVGKPSEKAKPSKRR